jgi:vesicle transport through interaction with t-SNAREs 1
MFAILSTFNASQTRAAKPTLREALFGGRYTDQGIDLEAQDDQRTRLLSGTERLEQSSQRLRESQRVANETESIGAGILDDLSSQRQHITNTRDTLTEADGYVDKSMRTLKGMARRYCSDVSVLL